MSSQTLPILSLTTLKADPSALATACTQSGFFYLTDHGIPTARLSQILSLARTFFKTASTNSKNALSRGEPDQARGYQRLGENVTLGKRDAHEAVDFYREWEDDEEKRRLGAESDGLLGGQNLWPHGMEEELRRYVDEVSRVGTEVVKVMGEALGLEGDEEGEFVRATERSFWVMRMIGYPPLDEGAEGVSCGEHTDYGCVTLLLADSTRGALQVLSKTSDWIDADPIEGAFVVNIGDMMERWTNGLWKSTLHRVIHKGSNYRVSVPFFFEPNYDATIKPLQKCVDRSGRPAAFPEVKYGDHLVGKIRGNFY